MKKNMWYILTGIIFSAGILFFTGSTVHSQEKKTMEYEAEYYDKMESEYIAAVKSVLSQYSCDCSGVTMTKIMEEGKARNYTVKIYDKRIREMEQGEREVLLAELQQITFPDETCIFSHLFI